MGVGRKLSLARDGSHFPLCGKTQKLVCHGHCGHVASWRLLFEFLLGRERSHFPPCGKPQKLMSNGRCGHGEEFPAACSGGGQKKWCYPAEGVADSLDEAQGEASPFQMDYLFLRIISMKAIMKSRGGTVVKRRVVRGMPNTVTVVVMATPKSISML